MDNNNMGVMSNSPSLTPQMMSTNANQMGMSAGMPAPLQANEGPKAASYGGAGKGQMFEMCKNHMNKFVQLTTNDNSILTGIITGLDDDYVHLAIPNMGQGQSWGQEQVSYCQQCRGYHSFHGGGFHGGGHGGRPPFHGGFYPWGGYPRPFYPYSVPLATLVALSLLPWY